MRLLCPNCDAEYEVDASVIPDNGRDVQCSNCGHAWFQLPPEVEAELEAEDALYEAPPAPAAVDPGPRRSIDESVLEVLREEAERETAARRTEPVQTIETQTEMGLAQATAQIGAPSVAAQRIARLQGIEPAPPPSRAQTRGEMLPEIEEINSTLRASTEKRSGEAAAVSDSMTKAERKGGSFRSGFVLMLILATLLVALYVMAPKIAQQIPGLATALDSYVAAVDQARLFLDQQLKSTIGWLRGLTGSPN